MPHFVIDCSENVIQKKSAAEIMQAVYDAADATGLFAKNDIKVRVNPFINYKLGDMKTGFLHVFGYIMEGRSTEQKADLSKKIVAQLQHLLPGLSIISMNVAEFEKSTYCNKALLDPRNISGNRHFQP
jgi:5-carboxymethyl-2-hydroxymuconate isomerase